MNAPRILVPFDAREAISVAEAMRIAGVSDDTLRRWASLHDLGRRIGGRWMLSRYALAMFLDGDRAALRAYLAGDRASILVTRYMAPGENENKSTAKTAEAVDAASGHGRARNNAIRCDHGSNQAYPCRPVLQVKQNV